MDTSTYPVIAICVATYKRPELLINCIKSIMQLEAPEEYKVIVIVVDNDNDGTARDIVEM